jgi:O-antigen/teichoic acid export membrane protein
MTRSARSTWNYITVLIFSAVSMVIALVTTPILLRYLGQTRMGGTRAVMDWTGYLSLLELGLGGALAPLLARELASEDVSAAAGMLAAGFRAYLKVTIGMLLGGILLVALITRLIRIDPAYFHDLRLATIIAAGTLLLMPLSPLRSLAEANQRGYIVNLFLIAQSVTIAVCAVFLAKIGWGIAGQLTAIAVGSVLFATLLVIDGVAHYRRMIPTHPTQAPPAASKALWSLNTPTLILNVCGRVGLLTDNIIIGSLLSASAIVPFLMTQRLAQLAQGQLQAIGSASWAALAQLHARGEHELFRSRFLELTRLVVMLGLIVLVPILAYNRAFVTMWVGAEQYAGLTLTSLAVFNALILALSSLWGWVFSGTGQMARLVPLSISSATLNLIVSLGATWWLSHHDAHRALWGPVIGTTSAYVLLNLPVLPILLRKHFGIPTSTLVAAVAWPVLLSVPYGVAVMWFSVRYPPMNFAMLAIDMSAAAAVFAGVCWVVVLSPTDRANWKLRLRLAAGSRTLQTTA